MLGMIASQQKAIQNQSFNMNQNQDLASGSVDLQQEIEKQLNSKMKSLLENYSLVPKFQTHRSSRGNSAEKSCFFSKMSNSLFSNSNYNTPQHPLRKPGLTSKRRASNNESMLSGLSGLYSKAQQPEELPEDPALNNYSSEDD
jgi:hypothetical protein